MKRVINIAVLECDTPIDPVKEKYGTYGDFFERLLQRGMEQLPDGSQAELRFTKTNVVGNTSYPNPDDVDAILMTGSKHDSFESDPWIVSLVEYTRRVLTEHTTKVVGICFGHQIIARAMGAKVGRSDQGWELSCTKFDLSDQGTKLFGQTSMSLHQMHRDIVQTMPEGFINLGSSGKCQIQGLYQPGRAISLQAHPEYNGDIISKIVDFRHGMGIFDDTTWEDALTRAKLDYDEAPASTAICRFLVGT